MCEFQEGVVGMLVRRGGRGRGTCRGVGRHKYYYRIKKKNENKSTQTKNENIFSKILYERDNFGDKLNEAILEKLDKNDYEDEIRKLKEKLKRCEKENVVYKNKFDLLIKENHDLKVVFKKKDGEILRQKDEIARLRKTLKNKDKSVSKKMTRIKELEIDNRKRDQEVKKLQEEISKLKNEVKKKNKEMSSNIQRFKEKYENLLKKRNEKIESLKSRVKSHDKELIRNIKLLRNEGEVKKEILMRFISVLDGIKKNWDSYSEKGVTKKLAQSYLFLVKNYLFLYKMNPKDLHVACGLTGAMGKVVQYLSINPKDEEISSEFLQVQPDFASLKGNLNLGAILKDLIKKK